MLEVSEFGEWIALLYTPFAFMREEWLGRLKLCSVKFFSFQELNCYNEQEGT